MKKEERELIEMLTESLDKMYKLHELLSKRIDLVNERMDIFEDFLNISFPKKK